MPLLLYYLLCHYVVSFKTSFSLVKQEILPKMELIYKRRSQCSENSELKEMEGAIVFITHIGNTKALYLSHNWAGLNLFTYNAKEVFTMKSYHKKTRIDRRLWGWVFPHWQTLCKQSAINTRSTKKKKIWAEYLLMDTKRKRKSNKSEYNRMQKERRKEIMGAKAEWLNMKCEKIELQKKYYSFLSP